jgi:AraC family transcriptional regulator
VTGPPSKRSAWGEGEVRRTLESGEFLGRRRDTRRQFDITCAVTEYPPDHRLPRHAHEQPFFSLLLRGSFRERLDRGRARDCPPNSVVFYPEHEAHSEAFGELGGRAFNVELGPRWLSEMRERGLTYRSGSTAFQGARLNLLVTRLYGATRQRGSGLDAEEIVLEMITEVSDDAGPRADGRRPDWLDRVCALLHERHDEVLRSRELADEAGVHPVYAARVFRRHMGCTFAEYQRRVRVHRACGQLARTSRPLCDIALEAGFSDQAHFTRRFKELTGLTPGRYRACVSG